MTLFAVHDQCLIGLEEVASRTRLARLKILQMVAAGTFPAPDRKMGPMPMWNPEKVRGWIIGKGMDK